MLTSGRHTPFAPLALLFPVITALILLTASCRKGEESAVWGGEVACVSADSIRLADGTTLRALSDTCLLVTRSGGSTFTITASASGSRMSVSSSWPLLDVMLRLEQQYHRADGYTYLTPLELYLNPLPARESAAILTGKVKNGYVVPAETRRYLWPSVNNNALWLLAASELTRLHNDSRWITAMAETAANISRLDRTVAYNPATGLIGGIPRYMVPAEPMLPQWLGPTGFFTSASLTVNTAYAAALRNLSEIAANYSMRNERLDLPEMGFDPDSLSRAVHRNLWLPAQGLFGGFLYGGGCNCVQLRSADNIGQALAVISGIANPAIRSSIMSRTPVSPSGVELFAPRTGLHDVRLPQALTVMLRTLWAVAASRVPDAAAEYDAATGHLLASVASCYASDSNPAPSGRPVESLILRGFLGASFQPDGTAFAPAIPSSLPGAVIVRNLHIRRARLNVIVRGTGSNIVACSLDGAPASPFIPASFEGEHTLEIALSPSEAQKGNSPATTAVSLPPPPQVNWIAPRQAILSSRGEETRSGSWIALINGLPAPDPVAGSYTVPASDSPQWIQFAATDDNGIPGTATAPHPTFPPGTLTEIPLSKIAKGGTRIIADRSIADRFVESNRWKNRVLRFEITSDREADYLIDMHYIHGLGIVNARRRVALRRLEVNSSPCGILVFPQLSQSAGAENNSWKEWQSLTSYSNPLRAHLRKGLNVIEIKFWQPSPVYVSPDANVLLADRLRLIRL